MPQSSPSLQVSRSDFVHLTGHVGEKENDPGTDPGKARGTLFSCPPVLRRSSSLGHWPVCVATWSLRVGHRAKPSRWRRNHSFIHLTNIYLAPPVCQAPWDPEVNQPESQTQREWAGRGCQDTMGAWLRRWAWLRAAPARRKHGNPVCSGPIFPREAKNPASLSNEFFSYFQILATSFKFLSSPGTR